MDKFNEVYQEVYKNCAEDLSKIKKEKRVKHVLILIVAIITIIIGIINQNAIMVIGIGFLVWLIISVNKQYNKYKMVYKEIVIKKFIHAYSDKLEYYPREGISSRIYNNADFERYYDIYRSEDLIKGEILEDCRITMAEVHTQREETSTDSDGNTTTSYVTLFHGLFAEIEMPKFLAFESKIRRNALLSGIFKGKQKLEMDSSEFEKIFDVNTTDKIQTMRILTSDVMQMLIDFKTKNKVTPEITLKENKLYIRFETGNVFEPSLLKQDINYDKLKKYYDIINFTFGLAEQLTKNIIEFEE